METTPWAPVAKQGDLLGAGYQSSVTDDEFTRFLVSREWN